MSKKCLTPTTQNVNSSESLRTLQECCTSFSDYNTYATLIDVKPSQDGFPCIKENFIWIQ